MCGGGTFHACYTGISDTADQLKIGEKSWYVVSFHCQGVSTLVPKSSYQIEEESNCHDYFHTTLPLCL